MENLTTQYIASQIVTIFVYIFLSLTYCIKNRKLILAFSFISNFLNAIAFILLGAYTSSAMCAISIFRDIVFIIDQKINGKCDKITKKDYAILAMIYGISIISIALTFKGFWTLLYAAGSMLYTYSIWQKNNKIYRFMGIPVTLLVIADSIYIKSIFGVILQTVVLICSTSGYIKYSKENNKQVIEKIKLLSMMKNEEKIQEIET